MKGSVITIIANKLPDKLATAFERTFKDLHRRFSDNIYTFSLANIVIILFQFIYLRMRFSYINAQIPLWYTKVWGDQQLADKNLLYLIPIISLLVFLVGIGFALPLRRYFIRHGISLIGYTTLATNTALTLSLIRIIFIASDVFEPLVAPLYLELLLPGLVSFGAVYFLLPKFISYAHDNDLVTNPSIHAHPGMLLTVPTARGGGFVYGALFLLIALIFVGLPTHFLAFYAALILMSLLGLLDDYQNTHPESKLRFLENPYLRLVALFIIVSIVATLGTKIFTISNPSGGVFQFNSYYISLLITTFWIVWVLNVLSWSNGIDGLYAGIVGVASVLIILLGLRFVPLEIEHKRVAVLAAISAGLSFGFIRYTWYPSKILWGFGAMTAGLVLSVLSIMISSKILTSAIIILLPFLDAIVTVVRRLFQGKNPLKGDRGHLHHLLIQRGWSIRKIAVFYWLTTAIFGLIGYFTADKLTLQIGLIMMGLVAFIIALLNIRSLKKIIAPNDALNGNSIHSE